MSGPSRRIGFLLSCVPGFKAINMQLERIAAMQQALTQALPGALSGLCRVSHESAGVVVVEADNSAVAAKLKALAPRTLAALRRCFPELNGLQVRVCLAHRSRPDPRTVRRIGPTGIASLAALAGTLPAGSLEAALERLVERQRRSDRQDEPLQREERQHDGHDDQRILEHLPGEAQPAPIPGDHEQENRAADCQQHQKADDA